MIRFVHPEAFLLAVPFVLLLRGRILERPLLTTLRVLLLACLLILLAEPYRPGATTGRDLVLVLDRSLSVPSTSLERSAELLKLAKTHSRSGDRIGLVTFGRDAAAEAPPTEDFSWSLPTRNLDREGTDLALGIETGLALIPDGRQGSILLISDGESNGKDPMLAVQEALRRGLRIDTVAVRRELKQDVAIEDVQVPATATSAEPFQFTMFVRAEQPAEVQVELLRDGTKIAEGKRTVRAGSNRVVLRDRIVEPGVHRYEARVLANDRVPENDRAAAVVRVDGPPLVLCVTPGGREDRLTRSLRASGLTILVKSPRSANLRPEALGSYRAIVLENVPLEDFPSGTATTLAMFVDELGGGLWMTGGRAAFGVGGWHKSAVEEVLPVSMEVRQEQRRFGLAMAIALDRSGSMSASVGAGIVKMDLANLGACAAIEMLGKMDTVAVAAIDTEPHEFVAPTSAADKGPILAKVRRIESSGGGIYVDKALEWGLEALAKTAQANKHLVVFGDAADSERPAESLAALPALVKAGITVSVIGLGKETDSDAPLLKDVARIGGGRVFFAEDPSDLPRVFAQETMLAARSSVCDEPTKCRTTTDMLALGEARGLAFPGIGGYSIAWRKPESQVGVVAEDEQKAPVFAFWQHGLGRTAALLAEADGELSGGLASWSSYGDFVTTVVRWLAGSAAPEQVFAELVRDGQDGILSVEVEKGHESDLASVGARVLGPSGIVKDLVLERASERKLVARFPMRGEGSWQAVVRVAKNEVLRVAPIVLPYSPEYLPQQARDAGTKLLSRIATETGGKLDPPSTELFAGPRESSGISMLGWPMAWAALALLLLEIAVRRLEVTIPWSLPSRLALAVRARFSARASRRSARKADPGAPNAPKEPEPRRDMGAMIERAKSKSQRRLE